MGPRHQRTCALALALLSALGMLSLVLASSLVAIAGPAAPPPVVGPQVLPRSATGADDTESPSTLIDTTHAETLSLAEATRILGEQNPDLETAAAAVDDAQAVVRQTTAALTPILVATGNYTRNNADAEIDLGGLFDGLSQGLSDATGMPINLDGPQGATIIQPLQSFSTAARIEIPLFAANTYWDLEAARAAVRSRDASREAAHAKLRGALVRAAWLVGAAEAFVGVAEHALTNSRAHQAAAERRLAAGHGTSLSVDQARLAVLRRRSDVATARAELEAAHYSLGALLGRDVPVRIELPEPPPSALLAPADIDDAVRVAIGSRPELRAAAADREVARQQTKSARMRLLPTLRGSFGTNASTVAYPTGLNYGWQAGVTLSWTIYDGGFRYGARRRAEAASRRARAQTRRTELDIRGEVRDAARSLSLARQRLELAEQEVEVAERAAASARRSFGEGHGSSLDVLDALDATFLAELRREEAKARLAAAAADLRTAQGLS